MHRQFIPVLILLSLPAVLPAIDFNAVSTQKSRLTEAVARLQALPSPDPADLARAYSALGMLDLHGGDYPAGEDLLRQAVSLAAASTGENSVETATYQTNLGLAFYLQGMQTRALPLLRRAQFVFETATEPGSVQMGTVLAELSAVEAALGKFAAAETDGTRALAIFTGKCAPGSAEIVLAQVALAGVYLGEHKTADAEKILPGAVAAERTLAPGDRVLADGLRRLAQLRAQQRRWPEAGSLYREALRIYAVRLGPEHPEVAPVRREYAQVLKREHTKSA